MIETRNQLLTRKRDLYSAIRLLDQDLQDGSIDEGAYRSTRAQYEREAADIVERLDALPDEPIEPAIASRTSAASTPPWYRYALGGALVLLGVALALFLIGAVRSRTGGESITGSQPGGASTPVPVASGALSKAQSAVRHNPKSVTARIALGNAYLNVGQTNAADASYRAAMKLAPSQPAAPTLHAMVLGSTGHTDQAISLLRQVESAHPHFARAWLTEGIIAAQNRQGYPRAIVAWNRFLALDPHSPVAPQVRRMIANTRAAERAKK